jgi:hypothetical protein
MTTAEGSLGFSGLFEAELLLELMLRYWNHPLANDRDFRSVLLENAAEALRAAIGGEVLIEDLPADKMNFVAAVWYVESTWVSTTRGGDRAHVESRSQWLADVRHSLPSCFCNPELLQG